MNFNKIGCVSNNITGNRDYNLRNDNSERKKARKQQKKIAISSKQLTHVIKNQKKYIIILSKRSLPILFSTLEGFVKKELDWPDGKTSNKRLAQTRLPST